VILDEDDYLEHYGTPRHSGRYPWGSGGADDEQTSTRNQDYAGFVKDMKRQGLTEAQIAEGEGISTTQLRARVSIASNMKKAALTSQIVRLREAGNDKSAIGRRLGVPESTVRSYLKDYENQKEDILQATANKLRKEVAEKYLVDIGSGAENFLGISATRLNTAATILKEEGYEIWDVNSPQITNPGAYTRYKVLAPPGTTRTQAYKDRDQIRQMGGPSEDGGETYKKIQAPMGISADRIAIRYGPEGGGKADGVIYVRPGVDDVSLGKAQYAQVRILVNDSHYLKGMAVYKDNLPEGVDLVFNTPKKDTGNKLDAMKTLESDDPLNPFGATIRDQVTVKVDGRDKLTSVMNLVNQEGSWSDWSDSISTQMLSKQSPKLIKSQLDMTFEQRQKEFKQISELTNPTVKQKLLETFADETDSAAVHLKAAGFKRQGWHAILPVESLSPSEVYAPGFRPGESVYLVRFPHGGTFEIPELTVNNNNREAKRALGTNPRDAIGIHHTVAERLSGADFDGDTVLVIPKGSAKLSTKPALEGLKDFNAKAVYAPYDGMKTIDGGTWNAAKGKPDYGDKPPSSQQKQTQMGVVSNLITDMTLRQAPLSDIVKAVRHSQTVIDAEKHSLNWKQSALDNNISDLALKYQGRKAGGAHTLISKASAKTKPFPERKARPAALGGPIDKVTGKREFVPTGRMRKNRDGEYELATQTSKKLAETDDAFTLSSGTPQERLYAEHSNKLKNLANQARLEFVATPNLKYSPSAKKIYAEEVKTLQGKLETIERNRPLERQAQIIANAQFRAKLQSNPNMDDDTRKKIKSQAINEARIRTGAERLRIEIEPNEWDAIQAGAISHSMLDDILDKANLDTVRKLATPKPTKLMTTTKTNRAMQMLASGASRAEVADALGVSLSTLDAAISGTDDE